uniref:SPOR domain-containing protein n=1 Tax=Falsiroseomonas oryzae TaxID=2766473 RepID=UPI0022EA7A55
PPVPAAAAPAQPAPPRPMTGGRVQVQLGALPTEEAARAEWDRLNRLVPELFQGRSPQISRLDRGEGQTPLFRLRTGGLPDAEAAAQFCEQVRARRGACVPVRS